MKGLSPIGQFFLVILLSGVLIGGGLAQQERPIWADSLYSDLETTAADINNRGGMDDLGIVEEWLIRNHRFNLFVTEGKATAVYSFTITDRLRVSNLSQQQLSQPTYRVTTRKPVMEDIVASEDKVATIHNHVQNGQIRVERVMNVLGLRLTVGFSDVAIAIGGLALVAFAVGKLGISGFLSLCKEIISTVIKTLLSMFQSVWRNITGIATSLTILEQLGLLESIKRTLRNMWNWIREKVKEVRANFSRSNR